MILTLLVLLAQNPVDRTIANALTWPAEAKSWAERLSDSVLASVTALPCGIEDRSGDCAKRQAALAGVAVGINEAVKRIVKRWRPDGSDDKSFFSMHTTLACVAGGSSTKRQALGLGLCAAVGYLRMAGAKHWFTDVLVGAGVGIAIARIKR